MHAQSTSNVDPYYVPIKWTASIHNTYRESFSELTHVYTMYVQLTLPVRCITPTELQSTVNNLPVYQSVYYQVRIKYTDPGLTDYVNKNVKLREQTRIRLNENMNRTPHTTMYIAACSYTRSGTQKREKREKLILRVI
jgi:hypothetical protein